ncbi:MAG: hypothetical protein Ta2B_20060 [Termitinemataceae bacterium]|nr:MAG: hypothetical protein Ta2B_20060 [Termitinemataceae bacterium]
MLYCHQCKVNIKGVFTSCPLCAGELSGIADTDDDVFPVISSSIKPHRQYLKFVCFGAIVAAVVSVAVDMSVSASSKLGWSLFVIAGFASLAVSFFVANKRWWNIPKIIFLLLLLTSVLEIAWDYWTGFHKWSLDYVIPIMFSASIVALSVYAHIRKLRPGDYMLILFITNIISVCALFLIIFQLVTVVYPALVCFVFSVTSTARVILFDGKLLREELKRRTHV